MSSSPGIVVLSMSSALLVLHDGLQDYRKEFYTQRDPSLPIWQIGRFLIEDIFEECVLAAFRGETHPDHAILMLEHAGVELESIKNIIYATVNDIMATIFGAFPNLSLRQLDQCTVTLLYPCDVMVTPPID